MSPTSDPPSLQVSRPVQTCPDLCPDLRACNRGRVQTVQTFLPRVRIGGGFPLIYTSRTFYQIGVDGVDGVDIPRAATVSAVQTFFTWSGRSGHGGSNGVEAQSRVLPGHPLPTGRRHLENPLAMGFLQGGCGGH